MTFPCTSCGACCLYVTGMPQIGQWADATGRCEKLAPDNKTCTIYEERPLICRVEKMIEHVGLPMAAGIALTLKCCDLLHLRAYGVPREQEGRCEHELAPR